MFAIHLFASLPHPTLAVLFGLVAFGIVAGAPAAPATAAPAAPPAAGDPPPSSTDAPPAGASGDVPLDGDPATGDEGDDDSDDEPDDLALALPHLTDAQLRTRLRRTQRFNSKTRPIVQRFRKPDGSYMSEGEVDAIVNGHREFGQLDAILRNSPRAVQVLMEEETRIRQGGGQPPKDEPAAFDEAAWPFETETPQGQALLSLAKTNHDLQAKLARVEGRLGSVDQRFQTEAETAIEGKWKAAAISVANAEIEEHARPLFVKALRGQFQLLKAQGQLTKANADDAVNDLLKEYRAARKATKKTTVTRQSAIVASNTQLPRTPRPGTVVPANGEKPAGRETIKDARESFLRRYKGA